MTSARSARFDRSCVQFAEFKPSELFKLTGMSHTLQRVWKRRGQLPFGPGEAMPITPLAAAEIFVRHQLALIGLPPGESASMGRESAAIVLWHALVNTDGACEIFGPKEEVEALVQKCHASNFLASEMSGVSPDSAQRYLYRYDGSGKFDRAHDLPKIADQVIFATLTLFDLNHMGTLLGVRAGRPLLTVRLPPVDTSIPFSRRVTPG